MEASGVARFPLPLEGRIPNFVGAEAAAARLRDLEAWREAEVVKANPDSPQRPSRGMALKEGKVVYMAVPRLREEKCFLELDPSRGVGPAAATIKGASIHGRPVAPDGMREVDFILTGCVAVDRRGGRVGKGGGFSDLEYAILREFRLVDEATPIATTVHPLQVVDEVPMMPHDIPVDYIATPEALIETGTTFPRPSGLQWDILDEGQIGAIPILQVLRARGL
jgi:5-formyltetrahydrofolate cyclo-ligase